MFVQHTKPWILNLVSVLRHMGIKNEKHSKILFKKTHEADFFFDENVAEDPAQLL